MQELTLIYRHERIRFPANGSGTGMAILECDYAPRDADGQDTHDGQDRQAKPADGGAKVKAQSLLNSPLNLNKSSDVTVRAHIPDDEQLDAGLTYRFYGYWKDHPKYGKQFESRTHVRSQPFGQQGVVRYLQLAPHIGRATADKLWERFGSDAVRILRETPEVAAAAVGGRFKDEQAVDAARWLRQEAAIEACTIELTDLLAGRGFPRDIQRRAVGEWGNRAARLIRRNPYLLMRLFGGRRFRQSDKLYIDLGGDPARLKRQALCAWHALESDSEGHTWHTPEKAEQGIRGLVAGAAVQPIKAIQLARRARLIAVHRPGDGSTWVADAKKAGNEADLAERVRAMLRTEPLRWPDVDTLHSAIPNTDLSAHQREQLRTALGAQLAILTGGPGTGKTFTAAPLIRELMGQCGEDEIAVAAPPGKAAVRIGEQLAANQIPLTASTIHRLLGVAEVSATGGWGFKHNEDNPLPFRFVVVDEASMIDTDLAASLLRACGVGTHVLLIGDTGQLPPVGHGAPLRDLIAAGVPTGHLTEVRRNAGTIVHACAAIREGRPFGTVARLDPDHGDNLKLLPTRSNAHAVEQIVETLRTIRDMELFDPVWECQVIVAVNAKSELSRRLLNKRLQRELNPGGRTVGSNPFRVGDKIVCLKNSLMPIADECEPDENAEAADDKVPVANGEQGRVVEVAQKVTVATLDAPRRRVKIPRGDGGKKGEGDADESDDDAAASTDTGCQWDLAYAISCHKSQGSEWPCVIVALDEYPGARRVCSREWLYTAVSRAKRIGLLIGKAAVAESMVHRQAIRRRKTFLQEFIQASGRERAR